MELDYMAQNHAFKQACDNRTFAQGFAINVH